MRSIILFGILAICLIAGVLTGCSGGSDITTPQSQERLTNTDYPKFGEDAGRALWFYDEIYLDPTTFEYEILNNRSVTGHWNARSWLEDSPCSNCLKIIKFMPSGNGTVLIDAQINHPFKAINLTGFDVRGIAIFNGSHTFPVMGLTAPDRTKGDGEIINPDGYTALYNSTTIGKGINGLQGYSKGKLATPIAPNSKLNGYKRFTSLGTNNTRNAFFANDSVIVSYEIDMPNSPIILGYAVDANWAPPTTQPVTNPITDFPPEANAPEPWKVVVNETPIGEGLTNEGGSTILNIDVYSFNSVAFDVEAECPSLFQGSVKVDTPVTSGSGYSSFHIEISNTKLASPGVYKALIAAKNKVNPTVPEWIDLNAYQIYAVNVMQAGSNQKPIAKAGATPTQQQVGLNVYFYDNGSYDPDGGPITKYEWDFDNDGTYDATGTDVSHSWGTPGTYLVQMRVTDNEGSTDTLDSPLQIKIVSGSTDAPIASANANPTTQDKNQNIYFYDNGSYDPDGGSITLFEWDLDGDGTYDQTGQSFMYAYSEAGTYWVQLRVTDDEDDTDTLDVPIQIVILP